MPTCVRVVPAGTDIGSGGPGMAILSVPVVGLDPSCSSGLLLFTQNELDSVKAQVELSVDAAPDPERVTDMQLLFYTFLAVLVVVWGMKQLLNMFTVNSDRD